VANNSRRVNILGRQHRDFKLYVMPTTGNEKGCNTVTITRP